MSVDDVGGPLGAGTPDVLGATPCADGVNFSLFSYYADEVDLLLFDRRGRRTGRQRSFHSMRTRSAPAATGMFSFRGSSLGNSMGTGSPVRISLKRGCALIRPSCCSIPMPGRWWMMRTTAKQRLSTVWKTSHLR